MIDDVGPVSKGEVLKDFGELDDRVGVVDLEDDGGASKSEERSPCFGTLAVSERYEALGGKSLAGHEIVPFELSSGPYYLLDISAKIRPVVVVGRRMGRFLAACRHPAPTIVWFGRACKYKPKHVVRNGVGLCRRNMKGIGGLSVHR